MAEPKKEPGAGGLTDALRRYVDAMAGLTEVSRGRAERIVAELTERGQMRTKDIQAAARELAERSARNRTELVRLVQKEIRRQLQGTAFARTEELDDLSKRVEELEAKAPRRSGAEGRTGPAKKQGT